MSLSAYQRFRPILISLSPNTEKDDILLAWKLLFQPWRWRIGSYPLNLNKSAAQKLEEKFKEYLGVKYAFSFNSGRSAFLAILGALGIGRENEILLQAFTCNAAVNPIIWSGLKPVYVDCDEKTLNIDIGDLKRKITAKSRGVVVQHTFGLPANLEEILALCRQCHLILIEDCAQALGAKYQGEKVGTFGQAAFFSFGRDKIISSVYGGMAVTDDDVLGERIRKFQEKLDFPSYFWIFQQLLHPILTNLLIIPLYGFFGLGRWLLLFLQKINILSKGVADKEKIGLRPDYFPKKMPDGLARLALEQFKKLEKFIFHQKELADFYAKNLGFIEANLPERTSERVYLRYPLLLKALEPDEILAAARKEKIFLDDGWRKVAVVPPGTDQVKMEYLSGSCPTAEKIAGEILNLPTHINISKDDARGITDFLAKIFFLHKPP